MAEIKQAFDENGRDQAYTLPYPDTSMLAMVEQAAATYPSLTAYEFFGRRVSYRRFIRQIADCARALRAYGIKKGDRVTVCLPNMPQALVMLYAVNGVGAVANLVHPLSGEEEIGRYLALSRSKMALILDSLLPKFTPFVGRNGLSHLVVATVTEALPPAKRPVYALRQRRERSAGRPVDPAGAVVPFRLFLKEGKTGTSAWREPRHGADPAVILYSGGTTGVPKGVLLSNLNFNALALQTLTAGDCLVPGHRMLAVMPLFHGFGLGVCVHTALVSGASCLLVPRFSVDTYGHLLRRYRPHYIAGVPTLYEALLRSPTVKRLNLSQLEGVFSGGDSLSVALKEKVDAFLAAHGATVTVREGYGTTECVTASCLTPKNGGREGSIGLPFPDMCYTIVRPGTIDPVPTGETGEICLCGPTVMLGYWEQPEATQQTLLRHADGRRWLHTGDLGRMDADGFVYFLQRRHRMIVTSGYNVYPSQVEAALETCPGVQLCAVIGVPDDYRGQRVKAFVVPQPGMPADEALQKRLRETCERKLARYAWPTVEFRDGLPRTPVGKIDYERLSREKDGEPPAQR